MFFYLYTINTCLATEVFHLAVLSPKNYFPEIQAGKVFTLVVDLSDKKFTVQIFTMFRPSEGEMRKASVHQLIYL